MRATIAMVLSAADPARWLAGLTGPIFEKELRVSSRRLYTYAVRAVYPLVLIGFVATAWVESRWGTPTAPAYRAMRMAEAGKAIVAVLLWFQFCALHLLAIVMPSTAIGDEVRRQTLGILMTTPITSFQVVAGKLLSRLLQLLLLLAVSLPVLVVVRVFGGVSVNYLAGGLAVTLVTVLLAASVSLYFSVGDPRSYVVILRTLVGLAFAFGFVPLVWAYTARELGFPWAAMEPILAVNPYALLLGLTELHFRPGATGVGFAATWWLGSGVLLAVSLAVLALAVVRVRRAGLRQAAGGSVEGPRRAWRRRRPPRTRRIHGSPAVWKELRRRTLSTRARRIGTAVAVVGLLLTSYVLLADDMDHDETHIIYMLALMGLGILATAALAAAAVATEKEARTWTLLLATPMSAGHILAGKAAGVLCRSAPVWALLFLHLAVFGVVGYVEAVVPFLVGIVAAGVAALLTGTGLYLSVWFRRSTTAVAMNVGLALLLWVGVPVAFMLAGVIFFRTDDLAEWPLCLNPGAHIIVIAEEGTGRNAGWTDYHWPEPLGHMGLVGTTLVLALIAGGHALAGFAAACRACVQARQRAV